jgi:serralysin
LSRFSDRFFGNQQEDIIDGRGGNDLLDGGAGADVLIGGSGTDTAAYTHSNEAVSIILDPALNSLGLQSGGDAEGDRLESIENIIGSVFDDFIITNDGNNRIEGQGGDDFISGLEGDDQVFGGTGDDTLNGQQGFDTLRGNDDNDTLNGGAALDIINGGDGTDTASFAGLAGAVEVFLENTNGFQQRAIEHVGTTTATAIAQVGGINSIDELTSIENAIGTSHNDRMFGNGGANTLEGRNGNDLLVGNAGIDVLLGGDQNDTLEGGSEADQLNGGNNNDTLRGGTGSDSLTGGSGTDLADYSSNSGSVAVNLADGSGEGAAIERNISGVVVSVDALFTIENAIGTSGNDTLDGNNVANTLEGRNGVDTLFGRDGADQLLGGEQNDTLTGGLGADVLNGGNGSDTASYAILETSVIVNNIGVNINMTANVHSGADAAGDNFISIENVVGSAFSDTIFGDGNNNIIEGGGSADILAGAGGLDTFVYRNAPDAVLGEVVSGGAEIGDEILVDSNTAVDLRQVAITGIEKLRLDGAVDIDMIGAIMQGGISEAVSNGLSDTINIHGSNVNLSSFTFTTWSAADTINVIGTAGNDTLIGSNFNENFLGSTGTDFMTGNGGNDVYELDVATDQTVEAVGGGTDTVRSSITHGLRANIENLVLTGTANINGGGNILANQIDGNSGNNTLNGFENADTMRGREGNDIYHVDNIGDTVIEAANEGTDAVVSSVDFTLGANVENLNLTGAALNGTGNGLVNQIFGNVNDNRLDGQGGNDRLTGAAGNDTYVIDSTGDLIFETIAGAAGGTDTVESSVNHTLGNNVENLTLTGGGALNGTGNALDNVISGGGGVNFLDGKLGADLLTGNGGIDQFVFSTALGAGNIDTITDFSVTDDFVRLDDAVFAGLTAGFLSVAAFRIGAAAVDADDRIIYNNATGALLFDADGNGAAAAQQFATLSTGLAMTNADVFIF